MARRPIAAVVVVAAVLGASCGAGEVGGPEAVRAMVLETCAPGGDEVQTEVCLCAYEDLQERFDDDELEELDRQLRDDPESVPEAVQDAVLACAFEQVEPPTTAKPTTTSSTTSTTSPESRRSTTTTSRRDSERVSSSRPSLPSGSRRRRMASGRGSSPPACASA